MIVMSAIILPLSRYTVETRLIAIIKKLLDLNLEINRRDLQISEQRKSTFISSIFISFNSRYEVLLGCYSTM